MSDNQENLRKLAKDLGVPQDNVYTEESFAKSQGLRWSDDGFNEIAAEQEKAREEKAKEKGSKD